MRSAWKPLNLPALNNQGPLILLQHDFGPSTYAIWLTNLTHIWTEVLDRRRIIQRALNINTSIDPSEDSGQMRLFLSSIEKALDGEAGTDVTFSSSNHGKQLLMQLSTPLPASLPALRWELLLQRSSQSTLTTKLVLPLLANQITAKVERTSLLRQLKEKDHVISKLIDQMQTDGSDMNKVFPGTMAPRHNNKAHVRQTISKSVKGVGEFDENMWKSRISEEHSMPTNLRELLSKACPIAAAEISESFFVPNDDAWWNQSKEKDVSDDKASGRCENGMDVAEDDFQTQTSPPNVKQRNAVFSDGDRFSSLHPRSRPSSEHASSTTDDSDGDLELASHNALPIPGATGNRADSSVKRSLVDSKQNENVDSGSDRNSMDLDATPSPRTKSPIDNVASQSQAPGKPKSKLGKIGGKKKVEAFEVANKVNRIKQPNASRDPSSVQSDMPKTSPATISIHKRGRTEAPAKQPSPVRETSQERANRKRETLKRELDIKSHAGSKKKRRF